MIAKIDERKMGFRATPASLMHTVKTLSVVTSNLFHVWDKYHRANMTQVFNKTYATSMVATGETRSKLFKVRRQDTGGATHIVGYDSTSNDQSVAQEFDEGKVHRQEKHHWHLTLVDRGEYVAAKCSRAPVDLWSFTKKYDANPRARRRAFALSIEEVFSTSVRYAVRAGGDLYYRPSLSNYERVLNAYTSLVLSKVFGGR